MSGNGVIIVYANNNQAKTELNICNGIANNGSDWQIHSVGGGHVLIHVQPDILFRLPRHTDQYPFGQCKRAVLGRTPLAHQSERR